MKGKVLDWLKFSPLIFLAGAFAYSFFNYGVLDNPGKLLYKKHCADCHGIAGEGIKQLIPPLKNADMAMEHFDSIACWIRNGMNGAIVVNGKEYDQMMYPIKLNEVETANILNYMAKEFFNSTRHVSAAEMATQLKQCAADEVAQQ
ncbi:MAG: cytochrome c [Chitinophagales bacterium]|nr:cytochrome c [Chitinophagales bacterium]